MTQAKSIARNLTIEKLLRISLLDFLALTFIYFLPTLSHLTALPLYMIDPMRIAVLFCPIHTNRNNAFLIAITLPLFSLIVSSHPAVFKTVLIATELVINLFLFYYLIKKMNVFLAMFLSIMFSKIFYYSGKYLFLHAGLVDGDLISTSLIIQWIVMVGLSLYAAIMFKGIKIDKS